jgi:hypothetical protein
MSWLKSLGGLLGASSLVACVSSPFDTSWRAPDATPLQVEGAKVAAIAMMENETARRAAEDALVRELEARGAHGVAMYTIMPGASPADEGAVRAALDGTDFAGAVVLRPVDRKTEVISEPIYLGPDYASLWGGYYGFGWREPWRNVVIADVRTRTTVSIEVLVYSLRQNRLVWGGQTQTSDTVSVERLVDTTAKRVARELTREGLLPAG